MDEEVDLMADLMRNFEALNIPIDDCTIEEFMHIDDKNKEVFLQEILDDNEVMEAMQTKAENVAYESDHAIAKACTPFSEPTEDKVNFCGFENMYVRKSP